MTIRRAITLAALLCLAGGVTPLAAQSPDTAAARRSPAWELGVPSGVLVPTGAQRGSIRRGNLSAAQVTWVARPALALTTTLGWARTRDAGGAGAKLDVFTYDVGAEVRSRPRAGRAGPALMAFAGLGAGGRSYRHRHDDADARHHLAAYASLGGELGVRRVRLRLDVRDYVTGFTPPDAAAAGRTRARNEVVVLAGLRLVRR